ncbi:secreted antigen 3, partial [Babesia divergens]
MSDCNFQDPKNLKEILELLDKLNDARTTRHKVFEQLKNSLQNFCDNKYLDAFYRDRGSDYGFGGSIQLLTKAGENVSEAILQRPPWDEHLDREHAGHSGQDCALKIANAFKACLPKAFSALLFLFFNCDSGMTKFGGGSWNTLKVNGSGENLGRWLIGEDSESDFIARGFSGGELHTSNKGQKVAEELENAVSLTNSASLQKVLCGFMFVCKWHKALLGHTCLFLSTFCSRVSGDSERFLQRKYADNNYDTFKRYCQQLKPNLDSLANGTTSGLQAVCQQNQNLFKDIWKEDAFEKYCEWLSTNLGQIIESLQEMLKDSENWKSSSLTNASSAGPFKYGFVFKDKGWDGKINSKLKSLIEVLTGQGSGSLHELKKCLKGPETPTSQAQVSHASDHSQAQSSN